MNEALLQALRTLRNEAAHGNRRPGTGALAKQLQDLGISVPPDDMQWFVADLIRGSGAGTEHFFVPRVVLDVVRCLLAGQAAKTACDPWAGLGVLAAVLHEVTQAQKTIAYAQTQDSQVIGRILAPQLEWRTGRITDPLPYLDTLDAPLDVVASVLPFGIRMPDTVEVNNGLGASVRSSDHASVIISATSIRLAPEGVGLFVVPQSFFFAKNSILADLPHLGLGLEAALALPTGSFAPYTSIAAYLVVVRRRVSARMFVAQLSQDLPTNRQIVANLREERVDGPLELGRFVTPEDFRGLKPLRFAERLRQEETRWKSPGVKLADLAKAIQLGRPGDDFEFARAENAIFIPLIGITDVVDSAGDMTLKRQNYAQAAIDATRSDARFVARFLNTDLGREIREANKSGTTIPKLNTLGIRELRVFVPSLEKQRKILEIEARLEAEQNTLLGLNNDLGTMRRDLWSGPNRLADVDSRLQAFAGRLAAGATPQVGITLEQWFETLPFPLASILRAWQATPSQEYKTKYEHLLHFFEAAAEFVSVIYLSAFSSNAELFSEHRSKMMDTWKKQNLSLERATFGTWKVVVEYLGSQTRKLLSADAEKRALCAEFFADPTLSLPEMLARAELATVLSAGNKMRNDWTGHGGVVGEPEARLRNESLLSEVQKLRDVMADGWDRVQMIQCLHCKPRHGKFDNEVATLVGSNSEFLKETRSMSSWLDVERLYLASRQTDRALLLLPLVHVGPSPSSAKNACYFFNRIEKDGVRFVSYHFVDQPEHKDKFADATAAINYLTHTESVSP